LNTNSDNVWGRRLAWSRLRDLGCSVSWAKYEQYLVNTHYGSSVLYLLRYPRQYHAILQNPHGARELLLLAEAKRGMVMAALSNLSRYLGFYKHWKSIIRDHGLRWEKNGVLDTITSILNTNLHDTEEWLFNVSEKLPTDASCLIAFISLTGLRIVESCKSARLIEQVG